MILAVLAVAAMPATAQEDATVTIIHGIPGPDGLPVDVSVDGLCIEDFTFGTVAGPVSLAPDSYTVEIKLPDGAPCAGTTVIGPADIEFLDGENASVIAHLDADGGFTASKFTNDVSEPFRSQGRVIARHTAAAGAVDVSLSRRGNQSAIRVSNVQNTQGVGVDDRPGSWLVTLSATADGSTVLGPAPVNLRPFTALVLYAVGSPTEETFTVIADSLDLR